MTVPWLMNCPHSDDSWCLDCVVKLGNEFAKVTAECDELKARIGELEKAFLPESFYCLKTSRRGG